MHSAEVSFPSTYCHTSACQVSSEMSNCQSRTPATTPPTTPTIAAEASTSKPTKSLVPSETTSPLTITVIESTTMQADDHSNIFTNATLTIIPATESPEADKSALIGGIVGGVVALILVAALIGFIVARIRQQQERKDDDHQLPSTNAAAVHSATVASPNSNYGHIQPSISNYSEHFVVESPSRGHYDSLAASEI
jgi:hypothetical protein